MTDSSAPTQSPADHELLRIDATSDSDAPAPWFVLLRQTWQTDGPEPSLADFEHDPDEALAWFSSSSKPLVATEDIS